MTQVIIATHGPLARAMKDSLSMFFPKEKCDKLHDVMLFPEDSPNDLLKQMKAIVDKSASKDILILVDIFGGTPFNTAALLIDEYEEYNIQCLTGVNMPLLMEILSMYETSSLDELLIFLENIAKDSIVNLRQVLEI